MKKISGYLIGFTLIVALLSCAGWLFGSEFLKHPFNQSGVMLPITAISIVLGSVSFFLLYKMPPAKKFILAGRILGGVVLGVGLLKLLVITGIDLGLDHWPYRYRLADANIKITGPFVLTTINSSLGSLLSGSVLLLSRLKGRWPGRIINYMAVTGFVIGAFAFIGFIYNVREFYGILPYMAVAPSTALCFICFSVGMLFANCDSGFMATFNSSFVGGRIARVLIPVGILAPFVSGYISIFLASKFSFSNELNIAELNTARMVAVLLVIWLLARVLNNSDQKRQAAELQLEQQAQLFNIMPDAVLYGNKDFTITNLNPAAKRIFDVRNAEIAHIKLDDLFTPPSTGAGTPLKDAVQKDLWGEKGFWRGELDLSVRTGQKINALVMIKAIRNGAGEKVGWLGVYTDISPLRLNEELKVANNYLEQLAFISAHDIKSPILTLKGLVDMLYSAGNMRSADLPILDMQRKVIDEMQVTNKALNDILKLRKNLQTRELNDKEDLSLDKIVANITTILQNELELSGARLELQINEVAGLTFPQVYFQSLFYNLLSNSVKYRSPGRALHIKFTGRLTGNDEVKFTIEDNGMGFDHTQHKNKIFGIFKRFHTHVEGTGIGLHIVKSIVDAFEGNIEIESEPDKGTRFNLTFPIPVLS